MAIAHASLMVMAPAFTHSYGPDLHSWLWLGFNSWLQLWLSFMSMAWAFTHGFRLAWPPLCIHCNHTKNVVLLALEIHHVDGAKCAFQLRIDRCNKQKKS